MKKPSFIDHIVLMVKNVNKSKRFYSKFLGEPIDYDKDSVAYRVGKTKLFLGLPYNKIKNNNFNKDRIGLNHLAFGVNSLKELKQLKNKLDNAKIRNSGIKIDNYGKNPFIWFDDINGIRLEFYLRK